MVRGRRAGQVVACVGGEGQGWVNSWGRRDSRQDFRVWLGLQVVWVWPGVWSRHVCLCRGVLH